ncbi:collagen alpha-1(I) chain-like [Mustela nigripes]|uniref:collagen alpha-1(I) chain-like n=1 Tax=Mustela nigripes TaxID=77151 RepID=UPI002816497D|nr:collagen alpha-1(I) chain-like [Mustela nigripes]
MPIGVQETFSASHKPAPALTGIPGDTQAPASGRADAVVEGPESSIPCADCALTYTRDRNPADPRLDPRSDSLNESASRAAPRGLSGDDEDRVGGRGRDGRNPGRTHRTAGRSPPENRDGAAPAQAVAASGAQETEGHRDLRGCRGAGGGGGRPGSAAETQAHRPGWIPHPPSAPRNRVHGRDSRAGERRSRRRPPAGPARPWGPAGRAASGHLLPAGRSRVQSPARANAPRSARRLGAARRARPSPGPRSSRPAADAARRGGPRREASRESASSRPTPARPRGDRTRHARSRSGGRAPPRQPDGSARSDGRTRRRPGLSSPGLRRAASSPPERFRLRYAPSVDELAAQGPVRCGLQRALDCVPATRHSPTRSGWPCWSLDKRAGSGHRLLAPAVPSAGQLPAGAAGLALCHPTPLGRGPERRPLHPVTHQAPPASFAVSPNGTLSLRLPVPDAAAHVPSPASRPLRAGLGRSLPPRVRGQSAHGRPDAPTTAEGRTEPSAPVGTRAWCPPSSLGLKPVPSRSPPSDWWRPLRGVNLPSLQPCVPRRRRSAAHGDRLSSPDAQQLSPRVTAASPGGDTSGDVDAALGQALRRGGGGWSAGTRQIKKKLLKNRVRKTPRVPRERHRVDAPPGRTAPRTWVQDSAREGSRPACARPSFPGRPRPRQQTAGTRRAPVATCLPPTAGLTGRGRSRRLISNVCVFPSPSKPKPSGKKHQSLRYSDLLGPARAPAGPPAGRARPPPSAATAGPHLTPRGDGSLGLPLCTAPAQHFVSCKRNGGVWKGNCPDRQRDDRTAQPTCVLATKTKS